LVDGPEPTRGGGPPLHLHARAISLPLYPNRPPVTAEAPPPPHLLEALRRCGYGGDADPASAAPRRDQTAVDA
jgi:hypothetical protein